MLKILLWIASNDGRFFQGAINILERQHNGVDLIGVTANEEFSLHKDGKKIPFIPLNEINNFGGGECDTLLVIGAKEIGMDKITKAARQLNMPKEKLLGDWIVCIPGFTLEKYRRLQRSRLSVFSRICFGGLMLHTLGLPFHSPFVNLWLSDRDFVRFLRASRVYLEEKLILKEWAWSKSEKIDYPIVILGNVDVHMNHYPDFDEAVAKWNERKQRINWYNLFIVTDTEDKEVLEQFDTLPYGKKVCFVPFKSDLDSAWYINPDIQRVSPDFVDKVNLFGTGQPFYYGVFDMLLYGKKTQLIDM